MCLNKMIHWSRGSAVITANMIGCIAAVSVLKVIYNSVYM